MAAQKSRLLTTAELAAMLRMTPNAIYIRIYRDERAIPGLVRVGRSLRWREEEIRKWLNLDS